MNIHLRRACAALLLVFATTGALAQSVLVYDNNTDDQVALQACDNLGYNCTRAISDDFVSLLEGGFWDLVVMDLPSNTPNGAWQDALTDYINGGGLAIQTGWNSGDFTALAAVFEVSLAGDHEAIAFYQWNGHPLFNLPNSVPSTMAVADDSWGTNGFYLTLAPAGTAVAAAGFTSDPTPDNAASVIGNDGRTIFNGLLFDDFYPLDDDSDGKDDIIEYVENQMVMLISGLEVTPVPAMRPAGLLLMTLILGLTGLFWSQRRT